MVAIVFFVFPALGADELQLESVACQLRGHAWFGWVSGSVVTVVFFVFPDLGADELQLESVACQLRGHGCFSLSSS